MVIHSNVAAVRRFKLIIFVVVVVFFLYIYLHVPNYNNTVDILRKQSMFFILFFFF